MSKGLGKALASALEDPEEKRAEHGTSKHIFLNGHRREIFSKLTMTPCIGAPQISSELGLGQSTVRWHLDALVESGYVSEKRLGRKRVYYPQGLVIPGEVEFFSTLNQSRYSEILFSVIQGNGLTQKEIAQSTGDSRQTASKILGRLEAMELVTSVADGSNTRYYATKLLPDKAQEFYRHSKGFAEFIIKKLAMEGGKEPEIVKRGLDRIILELGFKSSRFAIEIGLNPYITCSGC